MTRHRSITALLVLPLVLAACGSSSSSPARRGHAAHSASGSSAPAKVLSGRATVAIRNYMYSPAVLTVRVGTKVTFHNFDGTQHTATSITRGFNTGTIQPGHSVAVTLDKPGVYKYHCLFHAFMVARIDVVRAGAS